MIFKRVFGLLLVGFMMVMAAVAQEPYSAVPANLKPSAYVADTLFSGPKSKSVRITTTENGLEVTVAEIFWAKRIELSGSKSKGILYDNLKPGELVCVIHFSAETSGRFREDSRDQKLRPAFLHCGTHRCR